MDAVRHATVVHLEETCGEVEEGTPCVGEEACHAVEKVREVPSYAVEEDQSAA